MIPEKTITNQKRIDAANKAVLTLRYRALETCSYPQLITIHEQIQEQEKQFEYDYQKEAYIAKNIGKTTWKSFCRFGDRNWATPGLILYWIKKDAIPLDEQAMFMSEEYGHEISPSDLANFMAEYDRGCGMYEPIARINELKSVFKDLTGFNYDFKWVKKYLIVEPEPAER